MKRNLLLVFLEDTNDWVGPLGGHPDAHTPTMDALGAMGTVFDAAYCNSPACSASRASALYSRMPWDTGVYTNKQYFSDFAAPSDGRSLIETIRAAGYTTHCAGKIFHFWPNNNDHIHRPDQSDFNAAFWDAFYEPPGDPRLQASKSVRTGGLGHGSDFGVDTEGRADRDEHSARWLKERIKPKDEGQLWALGLNRPHLPFYARPEFFDRIPEDVALPPGYPEAAFDPHSQTTREMLPAPGKRLARLNQRVGEVLHENGEYLTFLRSYLAAISYADHIFGTLVVDLEEKGLLETTTIVLCSDHGWQLGEKLAFRKFTLWERALRIPLIVVDDRLKPGRFQSPVTLADLAPTVCSLLDIERPHHFDGRPLLGASAEAPAEFALSSWAVDTESNTKLALSARSANHRLIQYWNGDAELYDHRVDPFEHNNLLKGRDMAEVSRQNHELSRMTATLNEVRANAFL